MTSKHLDEMEMPYFKHMKRASRFGFYCFCCAIKSFIHAVYPDVFTDTSERLEEHIEQFVFDTED
jgi:hypothetical protein